MSKERQRRIVVTGLGVFSPIGIGRDAFWSSLQEGRAGIRPVEFYKCSATPGGLGGEVWGFTDDAVKKVYLKEQRKSIKVMCREVQLGTAAAIQAVADAGLSLDSLDHERVGVEYGCNLMFFPPETLAEACGACRDDVGDFQVEAWGGKGISAMEPLWMLRYLPNMPACHIAIIFDARGPNNSVTLDEASPGVALTEALNIMERGAADVMLVGGTGTWIHPVRAIHANLYTELGYDPDNPVASQKPFDARRNGAVASEGSCCLVLEEESHAKARGAKILGTFLGGHSSCVAGPGGKVFPGQALLNSARGALRRAGVDAASLGHINAHGLGTVSGDRVEADALKQLLGPAAADVPVTGMKGYWGNGGATSGFFEILGSLLTLQQGRIPRSLNCDQPDESLGLNLVGSQDRPTSNRTFMNVNYARNGQASAVVFEAN